MTQRTPYDGEPFYCDVCGLGLQEVMACEDGICAMESAEKARARQHRQLAPTGADVSVIASEAKQSSGPAAEVDRRLAAALGQANRSALGMPASVDTLKAMLDSAGLALVLAEELRP